MAFHPDYGQFLLDSGFSRNTSITFSHVPISHIMVISEDLFTVMINRKISETEEFALSFDFSAKWIGKIFEVASPKVQTEIKIGLEIMSHLPFDIQLSDLVIVSIECHLGETVKSEKESFNPFIVDDVW